MLPNEEFARACRAYYDKVGLDVGPGTGEFAHCPYPKAYLRDAGYYLTWAHHQQQGLLQTRDLGEICFYRTNVQRWLKTCDPWPDDYFGLWDIYDEYTCSRLQTRTIPPVPVWEEAGIGDWGKWPFPLNHTRAGEMEWPGVMVLVSGTGEVLRVASSLWVGQRCLGLTRDRELKMKKCQYILAAPTSTPEQYLGAIQRHLYNR